jgi:hypothetical protein
VTNGRYQELEFNGSFSAMNRKSGRSTPDPFLTVVFLQRGRSEKIRLFELVGYKAATGGITQPANTCLSRCFFEWLVTSVLPVHNA